MKKVLFFSKVVIFFLAVVIIQIAIVFLLAIGIMRFILIIANLFLVSGHVGLYIISLIPVLILLVSPVFISGAWIFRDVKKMLSVGIEIKPKIKPQDRWFGIIVYGGWVPGLAIYLTLRKFYWKKSAGREITIQS